MDEWVETDIFFIVSCFYGGLHNICMCIKLFSKPKMVYCQIMTPSVAHDNDVGKNMIYFVPPPM